MSQTPEKFDGSSTSITDEQKAKLKSLFPEIITEGGKIDFDRLKLTLGESVDVGKERYGMNWPGKADCFKTIQKPSMATLVPARDESVNFDTTENLIIEGDNLEALKLLQKAYIGKVKMIFIDPPYNIDGDFIYPDDYSESLETYLRYTGQVDNDGRKFSTNTETDGRFHSKWMNMIYPRLFLARNLLRNDGVIFISIDDHEADNLVKICREVFGEENFLANMVWQSRTSISNDQEVSLNHNHILIFSKDILALKFRGEPLDPSEYSNPDNDPRGPWKPVPLDANKEGGNTKYPITNPNTGEQFSPPSNRSWAINPEEYERLLKDKRISFGTTGKSAPKRKMFLKERQEKGDTKTPSSILLDAGTTQDGTNEVMELFDGEKIFSYPKPTSLLIRLLNYGADENSIILDFFGGSGTTAQAVLESNKADRGNRKFILVQLPEPTERKDYPTIADITKERVRRVIKKLNEADKDQLALGQEKKQDRGFKVFKLQSSNFKAWNAEQPKDDAELVKQLTLHTDHLVEGRTQEDVLYELLIKSGFPLDTKVEKITLAEKGVFSIADGAMLICLEKALTPEVINAMAEKKPERVVCLDAGFADNDQLKTNAVQTMKSKGVTKFQTV